MTTGRRARVLIVALLAAAPARPAHADAVLRGRMSVLVLDRGQGETVTRYRRDRRSEDFAFDPSGDGRMRTIVRLDKRVIWWINFAESTYTEVGFDHARSVVDLLPPRPESGPSAWREVGHGTFAGVPVRHLTWSDTIPAAPPGSKMRVDAWIASATGMPPEVDTFERDLAKTGVLGRVNSIPSPLRGMGAALPAGVPMRVRTLFAAPGMNDRRAGIRAATPVDSMRALGFGPEQGGVELNWFEVTGVREEPVPDGEYEPPPGFRKKVLEPRER
jgi:hypothetical protein